MSQLFEELKRRNVFRIALAYAAVAWLILQLADVVLDNIEAPPWLMQTIMLLIVIGFPVALIFAWAFEMTPEGIKKEAQVDRSTSITQQTGKKLDRVIIAVLGIAVAFLLFDKFSTGNDAANSVAAEQSVAVLPFVAMSRGPDDEYFADGLTEEILNSLTRIPELLVTARTSSFFFKGQDIPIPEIAEKLGVAHIVEGSVRRDGDRLRVTAQLIRAEDGFHLWSENYDRDTSDTFGVQTSIAEKIALALDVVLDDKQRQEMLEYGVRDPEAFVAYQKGVELFNAAHGSAGMLESLEEANKWFDLALELEPGFALANLNAADYFTHILLASIDDDEISDDDRETAMQEIRRYHKNAARDAGSQSLKAVTEYDLAVITGQWGKLPALLDDLLATSDCIIPNWLLETTIPYGYAEQLLTKARHLTECDPLSFSSWVNRVGALANLGEYDAAIDAATAGLDLLPHIRIYQQLFFAYLGAGRYADAKEVIDRHVHRRVQSVPLQLNLIAAQGDAAALGPLMAEVLALGDEAARPPLVQFAITGNRQAANQLAAELDARPYGHLTLMVYQQICRCGAPFDLEATPNFARLIEEADFQWPPVSSIEYPLKDW